MFKVAFKVTFYERPQPQKNTHQRKVNKMLNYEK